MKNKQLIWADYIVFKENLLERNGGIESFKKMCFKEKIAIKLLCKNLEENNEAL